MDLNKILPKKDKDKHEYFWSVAIEPEWVQVSLWYTKDDTAYILASSQPTPWEYEKELVEAVDSALSYVVQNTHEEIGEPSKTVFGVIDSWVNKGQILPEHLEKIKKICNDLSLTPVGFVVISEAIANYFRFSEGSPFSGVILGISKDYLNITVFGNGIVSAHTQVARSLSVVDDAVEGLTRMNTNEPVPPRFIIFNAKREELEEAKQSLIKAHWEDYKTLKFLHTPKIDVIYADKKIEAVSLGGASDISKATKVMGAGLTVTAKVTDNFEVNEQTQKVTETIKSADVMDPEELGFAVGQDIQNMPEPETTLEIGTVQPPPMAELPHEYTDHDTNKKFSVSLKPITAFFSSLKPSTFGGSASTGKKVLLIGAVVLFVLIIASVAAWWIIPKASVTLYLSTQGLDEEIEVTVDPSVGAADLSNRILPARVLTKDVEGSKTKSTTGRKTVGERATGEITLYRVGSSIVLDSGTQISGPGGLNFTLDSETEVASGSASTPGTTNAKITASDIGADYNLSEGSTFSVGNFSLSTVEAKNDASFSGGSSRDISAVSEEDQKVLLEDLNQELRERAIDELTNELNASSDCPNCKLIPESYVVEDSNSEYNAKIDDEAENLSLDLTLSTSAIALNDDDLVELARGVLESKVPQGYVLRDDQIDTSFEFKEEDGGKYFFTVDLKANLFPDINPIDIAEKIAGKKPDVAKDFFTKEIPSFVRAEISMRPKLPAAISTLPHLPKNIEVIITSEGK